MVRSRLFLGFTILALTLSVSSAFAQTPAPVPAPTPADEEARALFEAGRIAFGNRRYTQALEMFERAYELSPRPALLYNLGSTLDRLRRDREAVDAFRRYLEGEPNSPRRAEVEERITILEQQLATSPQAVARAGTETGSPETDATVEHDPITKKWWFWTIIGVAVVGTAVGVGVAVAGGGTQGPATAGPGTMVIEL